MLWTSQKPQVTSLHHRQMQQPPQLLASNLSPSVTQKMESQASLTAPKLHLKAPVAILNRTQLSILIVISWTFLILPVAMSKAGPEATFLQCLLQHRRHPHRHRVHSFDPLQRPVQTSIKHLHSTLHPRFQAHLHQKSK